MAPGLVHVITAVCLKYVINPFSADLQYINLGRTRTPFRFSRDLILLRRGDVTPFD